MKWKNKKKCAQSLWTWRDVKSIREILRNFLFIFQMYNRWMQRFVNSTTKIGTSDKVFVLPKNEKRWGDHAKSEWMRVGVYSWPCCYGSGKYQRSNRDFFESVGKISWNSYTPASGNSPCRNRLRCLHGWFRQHLETHKVKSFIVQNFLNILHRIWCCELVVKIRIF